MQTNLLGLDLDGLGRWLEGHGEKAFRAKQLAPWLHQRGVSDFDAMTDIAKSLRATLACAPGKTAQTAPSNGCLMWVVATP
jgi:23S rRNA (adenine2503-C2)-methyltransferase